MPPPGENTPPRRLCALLKFWVSSCTYNATNRARRNLRRFKKGCAYLALWKTRLTVHKNLDELQFVSRFRRVHFHHRVKLQGEFATRTGPLGGWGRELSRTNKVTCRLPVPSKLLLEHREQPTTTLSDQRTEIARWNSNTYPTRSRNVPPKKRSAVVQPHSFLLKLHH